MKSARDRLRELPEELGMKRYKIAEEVGFPRDYFRILLSDGRRIHVKTIKRIGYHYGYIPILIRGPDGQIVDLEKDDFYRGIDVGNYEGRAIRKLREAKKLSQDGLAKKVGTSRQSINSYETGKGGTVTTLEIICESLGSTVEYIVPILKPLLD